MIECWVIKPFLTYAVGDTLRLSESDYNRFSRVGRVSALPPRREPGRPSFRSHRVIPEAGPSVNRSPAPESHPAGPRVTVDHLGRGWYVVAVDGVQETREDGTVVRLREQDAYERAARLAAQPIAPVPAQP